MDYPIRCASLAALRALTYHERDQIAFAVADEANFRFVPEALNPDDGSSWLKPDNVLAVNPGRWKRILVRIPDVEEQILVDVYEGEVKKASNVSGIKVIGGGTVTQDGDNAVIDIPTGPGSGGIDILDDGPVMEDATALESGNGLEFTDAGGGKARLDALPGSEDAPGIVQFATNGEVADLKAVKANDSRIPSQDEKEAMAGTAGTPSNSNRFLTDDDPRIPTGGAGAAVTPTGTLVLSQGDTGVFDVDLAPASPISAIMYRATPVGEGENQAVLLRQDELPEEIVLQTATSGSVTVQVQSFNDGVAGRVRFSVVSNSLTADDVAWPILGIASGDIPIYQSKLFMFGDITELKGSYSPNQANREIGNLRFGHYLLTSVDGAAPFQSLHLDGHRLALKGSTDVGGVGAAGWEDPETGTGAPGVPGQAGQPVDKTWGHFPDAIKAIAFRGNLAGTIQGDTLIIDASGGGGGGGVNVGIAEIVGLGFAPVDDMAPVDPQILPTGEDMVENVDGLDVDDDEPNSVIQLRYLKGGTPAPGVTPVDILSTDTWEQIVQKVADTINGLGKPISAAAFSNYLRVTRAKQSSAPLTVVYSTDGKIQAQPVLPGIGPNDPGGHKVYTANITLSPLGINPTGVMLVNEASVASQNMAVGDRVMSFQNGASPLTWHCSQFSTWE